MSRQEGISHRVAQGLSPVAVVALLGASCPLVLVSGLAFGADTTSLHIIKGPYLQSVKTDGITIMWETDRIASSRVDYGETEAYGETTASANPEARPYCNTIHEVPLSDLKEQTLYHYRVTSEVLYEGEEKAARVASEDCTFATAPARETPFSFAVFGDNHGKPEVFRQIIEAVARRKPAFAVDTGDLADEGQFYECWATNLFDPAKEFMKNTPIYAVMGNHDRNSHWFYGFFSNPHPEDYYSFDYGNAHFAVVDSNDLRRAICQGAPELDPGSLQYRWLEEDLRSSDATWKFVFFHYPPYSSYYKEGGRRTNVLCPLFEQHGVDMVFNGHVHSYERTYPLRNNEVDEDNGIVYTVTGGASGTLMAVKGELRDFSAKYALCHHYCFLEIDGDSLKMRVYDLDDNLIDSLDISKAP